MSYENTQCPCGGKKPTQTMLCDDCLEAFKDRKELATFQDTSHGLEMRRHAAIILLSLARRRNRQESLPLQYKL